MNNRKVLRVLIVILTIEKILQHVVTAVLFTTLFSTEHPDIGNTFQINNETMVVLNAIYALVLVTGLYGFIRNLRWGTILISIFAGLDILLEFIFHGSIYITVSVIVSAILVTVLKLYSWVVSNNETGIFW